MEGLDGVGRDTEWLTDECPRHFGKETGLLLMWPRRLP